MSIRLLEDTPQISRPFWDLPSCAPPKNCDNTRAYILYPQNPMVFDDSVLWDDKEDEDLGGDDEEELDVDDDDDEEDEEDEEEECDKDDLQGAEDDF